MTKSKNHSAEFKARVALDALREEMTLAELSNNYGVYASQISTCKRVALNNMTSAFQRRGRDPEPEVIAAEVEKLHSKIGLLVAERDFWADASRQLVGTRGKYGEQGS